MEHLLYLTPHRIVVLKVEGRRRADFEPPLPLYFGNPPTLLSPNSGVFAVRQDIFAGQLTFIGG
jgi:hypothetical protein